MNMTALRFYYLQLKSLAEILKNGKIDDKSAIREKAVEFVAQCKKREDYQNVMLKVGGDTDVMRTRDFSGL